MLHSVMYGLIRKGQPFKLLPPFLSFVFSHSLPIPTPAASRRPFTSRFFPCVLFFFLCRPAIACERATNKDSSITYNTTTSPGSHSFPPSFLSLSPSLSFIPSPPLSFSRVLVALLGQYVTAPVKNGVTIFFLLKTGYVFVVSDLFVIRDVFVLSGS